MREKGVRLRIVLAAALAAVPYAAAPVRAERTICVAIVVDPGPAGSYPPSRTCVRLPEGATGADALAARATDLDRPAPRYQGNFLCAIDGYPAAGCGTDQGATHYWSYWHRAGGGWEYSDVGVGGYVVEDGGVEGWHYIGTVGASAPPPEASYDEICPKPSASPTAARVPPPDASATARVPAPEISRRGYPRRTPLSTATAGPAPSRNAVTTPAPQPTGSGPATPVAEPPLRRTSRSVPVGPLAGTAAILALGAAAALRFRR